MAVATELPNIAKLLAEGEFGEASRGRPREDLGQVAVRGVPRIGDLEVDVEFAQGKASLLVQHLSEASLLDVDVDLFELDRRLRECVCGTR